MRFATIRRVSKRFLQSPCVGNAPFFRFRSFHIEPALRRGFVSRRGKERIGEGSTMSDFNRNTATAQYGRLTGAEAAVVDVGLRAYMLRIYNYMVIGLAITGFAALGIYLLSVTTDPCLAMQGARPLARGMYLTQIGYYLFASPLKW